MALGKGLFEVKAYRDAREAVSRALSATPNVTSGLSYVGAVGDWDLERAVQMGMEKVVWIFRCVDVIAQNQANLDMMIRQGDPEDGDPVKDERLYRLLNRTPNSYESAFEFRYRLTQHLLLSRKGAFIEIIRANDGRVAEVHLLPPHKVYPIPDPITFVKGYEVWGADYKITELRPDQVIWIKAKPHAYDLYQQTTPMLSLGVDAEMDLFAHLFNRNFMMNDGRPGLLIGIAGNPDQKSMEDLRQRFSGGVNQAGRTSVIKADELNMIDLAANPRDIQWMESAQLTKEEILKGFGVPESVMGDASGRTYDNADAEREGFWMDTMTSHCKVIARAFDRLTVSTDDDIFVTYDFDKVDVLQRRKRERDEKAMAEVTSGVRTIDSFLETTGREKWNVPGTRALFLPGGVAIPRTDADAEAIKALPIVGQPAVPGNEETARRGATLGASTGMRHLQNILAASSLLNGQKNVPDVHVHVEQLEQKTLEPVVHQEPEPEAEPEIIDAEVIEKSHPYSELRARMEGKIEGVIDTWSARQENVVQERLQHVKARKHTRHWEPMGTKALDSSYVVDVDRWVDEAKQAMYRAIAPMLRREAVRYADDLKAIGVLQAMIDDGLVNASIDDPLTAIMGGGKTMAQKAIDNALDAVMQVVEEATRRQTDRVMQRIAELDAQGATMTDIKTAVSNMIGSRSSWRRGLAVYVTTAGVEGMKNAVYSKAGNYVTKTWLTVGDEAVRMTHRAVDEKQVSAKGLFMVGGAPMLYPGDPVAPIGETANCRCWLEWNVSGDE